MLFLHIWTLQATLVSSNSSSIRRVTFLAERLIFSKVTLISGQTSLSTLITRFFDKFFRSSYQRCSMKKGVLKIFTKFRGKHLCQSLFFNKAAGLGPATLLKKRLWHTFSCEFCEISKNTFFTKHIWWLLLILLQWRVSSSFPLGNSQYN